MLPESNDERFEQSLRRFRPRTPRPLPEAGGFRGRRSRALAAVAALVIVAAGLVAFWNSREGWRLQELDLAAGVPTVKPAALNGLGGTVIPDLALRGLDGRMVHLSDLRGKVLLVNFWATWCAPCQIEMPWFAQFQERYGPEGFQVVAIAMDEDQSQCGPFIEQHGFEKLTVLLGDKSAAQPFGGILGLPTSFLLDRNGKIAFKHPGMVNRDAVEQEIVQLLRDSGANQTLMARIDTLATVGQLNRLMRDEMMRGDLMHDDPSQFDARLTEASRNLLPDVRRPEGTLLLLARE